MNDTIQQVGVFSLRDMLKLVPGNVYWKDKNGVYLGCSNNMARLIGTVSPDEIIGKSDQDILPFDLAEKVSRIDKEIMDSGIERTLEETGLNDRGLKAIYLTKKTPLFDTSGRVLGLMGVSVDITEDKKKQLELLERQKQTQLTLENIIDLMPGNIYWMDINGILQGCNNNQLRVLGLKSKDEFIGKSCLEFLKSSNTLFVEKANKEILKTGVKKTLEESGLNAQGEEAIYLTEKVPLVDAEKNIIGLLGISIDITNKKRVEQLEIEKQLTAEKLRLTEAFSATLAHDLRNPVSGLKMCIETIKTILNKEDMDSKEKKSLLSAFLEKGHDTADKALLFITMMLRKIGNIGKKVKKEELDLCMIAEDVKDALTTYCFTGIERTKVTWNKENAFVYHGNSLDTQHIVWNLVGNALKFIEQEEKGHITISFEQDTDYNKLIICDTAKGIEPQYMTIIFEAFVTKDESGKGTGLGLSFCKSTMQNYGGDITCESKFGEYTKFICTFPKVNMDEI